MTVFVMVAVPFAAVVGVLCWWMNEQGRKAIREVERERRAETARKARASLARIDAMIREAGCLPNAGTADRLRRPGLQPSGS